MTTTDPPRAPHRNDDLTSLEVSDLFDELGWTDAHMSGDVAGQTAASVDITGCQITGLRLTGARVDRVRVVDTVFESSPSAAS